MTRGLAFLAAAVLLAFSSAATARELRVCADPNNLPFSNDKGEGFENKVAEIIARELGATIRYTWWAQRRGFVRNTLKAELCDLWPGVASGMEMVATTRPWYRSSYVFVSRADRRLAPGSLDDPRLKTLSIGVQMVGNDHFNTPPAHALARRGLSGQVRGFMVYGDYATAAPATAIVDAVARGEVDAVIVWGPLAGWAASRSSVPLALAPVTPWLDDLRWPMVFDVSMGVRREDQALKSEVEAALQRRKPEIEAVLDAYHVPRTPDPTASTDAP